MGELLNEAAPYKQCALTCYEIKQPASTVTTVLQEYSSAYLMVWSAFSLILHSVDVLRIGLEAIEG